MIPLSHDTWTARERSAIQRVLDSGRVTMGPEVKWFEKAFAEKMEARYGVMVNSGSSALLLAAFWARELFPGPVHVPAVTWPTTVFPFMQAGYSIRFHDVDTETLLADYETDDIAVVVDLMGNRAPIPEGARYVVQDSCEAVQPLRGDIGCYSFYFSHHMSTGEGGMVLTNDDEAARWLRQARSHGWTRGVVENTPDFHFTEWGFNVRPTEIQAAVGSVQLERLAAMNAQRKGSFLEMRKALPDNYRTMTCSGVPFAFPIFAPHRNVVQEYLDDEGVEHRPVVAGNLTKQPVFRKYTNWTAGPLPGADYVDRCGLFIGLPSAFRMGRVCDILKGLP